ncbi:hypothetical protein AB4Z52_07015 [Rhizobium sp. 2YAF20]|uniref:hypothetical protein n=1 Tax=Rhizobium sp. 2YAF20 TaxID=3233027 RepID=UPI003F95DFC2
MSAYISILTPEACFLFTDAAAYDSSGVIQKFARKVRTAKAAPFAVTSRGNQFLGDKLQAVFCDIVDLHGVDGFLDGGLPELLAGMKADWFRDVASGHGAVEVHFSAWSESRGPVHASFQTVEMANRPSIIPFELAVLEPVSVGGPPPSQMALAGLRPKTESESLAEYCAYLGVALMQMMRDEPAEMSFQSDDDPTRFHLVGGHVDMTVITPDGTTVDRVHTWPDQVGVPIAA